MRIIALEEHTIDPAITDATEAAQPTEAPYTSDLRGGKEGTSVLNNRPYMLSPDEIMPRAADIGTGRIADMDAHGIDMQVLSYSNAPQLAPAGQGVELTRRANDRLAGAARAHPTRFAGLQPCHGRIPVQPRLSSAGPYTSWD